MDVFTTRKLARGHTMNNGGMEAEGEMKEGDS